MADKTPQTADNPNKAGIGPNKGDLGPGDIEWIKPPKSAERVNKPPVKVATKKLSGSQRGDLARRLRAKLGMAATKKP